MDGAGRLEEVLRELGYRFCFTFIHIAIISSRTARVKDGEARPREWAISRHFRDRSARTGWGRQNYVRVDTWSM
jgi:hypothetical protein